MIKLTEYGLDHPTTTLVVTALMVLGGIMSYTNMGRLEDPAFTIKDALVITPYPGASAAEVEEEVTNEIEIALQKLPQLKEIESRFADADQEWIDGLTINYDDWWCNIRPSNTEPVLRLNLEADNDDLLREKLTMIQDLILAE